MKMPVTSLLGTAAIMLMTGWASAAGAPRLAALNGVQSGQWELRMRGDEKGTRRICVKDPRQLLQVQHLNNSCKRFVVNDDAPSLSVTYDCGAAGSGRSDLRVETPRLVQIRSQGVVKGSPFAVEMEGRRIGSCR